MRCTLQRLIRRAVVVARLTLSYGAVDSRNLRLAATKEVARLQHVVYGWYKIVVAVTSVEVTRECRKEAKLARLVLDNKHAEHLATSNLLTPLRA